MMTSKLKVQLLRRCIQILYRNSQYNGHNSSSLYMLFPHICTKFSMLSTNFWDSPPIFCLTLCFGIRFSMLLNPEELENGDIRNQNEQQDIICYLYVPA